ncbi:Nif3-like dinuclear metal center hexameric protein [Georgenia faecalis]|uniref:GTP cyclohydrolase 1 type 2 homolog n=1 Tax=Georgenia faecalis TaxID=2483799 RepID=A0ABV9D9K2_9MICO|nr:Nif3-like dinuclear metal center hexameric protein [Georgenia faecalis]
MTHQLTLADVIGMLERRYPPGTAESWDAVGLVAGDPDRPVRKVMLAVDPVLDVAREALAWGADLLLTHHPLYLRGTHGVGADTPKGRVVHELIRGGCALYVAHTNADNAAGGVAEALAEALGIEDLRPLVAQPRTVLDAVATYVPVSHTEGVLDALAEAGAGTLGAYERSAFVVGGSGTFRPVTGADPTIGAVGEVVTVAEERLEMVVPRGRRQEAIAALRAAHPYEEPAFSVVELAPEDGPTGTGRIGTLREPATLRAFAERVAAALPATAQGIRVSGDLDADVRTVAVCGGSGDSLLGTVRALGADVYVTADLRHHPTSEARDGGRPFLVDAAHWASEWPWLPRAAEALEQDARSTGAALETRVSTRVTDPWTITLGRRDAGPGDPATHPDHPTDEGADQ